jgi:hypothetical protein
MLIEILNFFYFEGVRLGLLQTLMDLKTGPNYPH